MSFTYKIFIKLRQNILSVNDNKGRTVRSFNIVYGRNSHLGDKKTEGDQRTPRGEYYACTINEQSKFSLFFGLSYPNMKDADSGFLEGRISIKEFEEIKQAQINRTRPPWYTTLGGEVGIHGGGTNRDGTRGCIGLEDNDVIELKKYINIGTEVLIEY